MTVHQVLSTSTKPVPLHWVDSLFARMLGYYGNKFTDMWRGADMATVKALWAEEMGSLSNEELKRGAQALKGREWPPTLPEYIKLCRPPIDSTVAYYQAVEGVAARERGERGNWPHPSIFWAAMPLSFDLKNQTYSNVKSRWEKALAEQMEKGQWEPIPEPMLALPSVGKTQTTKAEAEKRISELGVKFHRNPTTWYKEILDREKRGDKKLTQIQIRFAKEAAAAHGYKQ